jgi:hypothetical protein
MAADKIPTINTPNPLKLYLMIKQVSLGLVLYPLLKTVLDSAFQSTNPF